MTVNSQKEGERQEDGGTGLRGGGIMHLGECHKAKNMPSFPAGSCAFLQASLHYSSGQQIVSFGDLLVSTNFSVLSDFAHICFCLPDKTY